MKKWEFCFLVFIFPFCAVAQTQKWQVAIGGDSVDEGTSIIQTKDRGYAITGITNSYGAGGEDVYVIKLDSSGNVKWAKTIGGKANDVGYSIIQTTDGGYAITGYTLSFGYPGNADVYIIKLDSLGDMKWSKTIGGALDDEGLSILQTKDKGYIIAGRTNSYGAGEYDVYLVKIDSVGNLKWTKTIGGIYTENAYSIIQTNEGGFAITGETHSYGLFDDMYVIKLDSNCNIKWTKTIGGGCDVGSTIIQTIDKGYAIAGFTCSYGAGGYDFYVVKLDSIGNLKWTRTIGDVLDDYGYSIVQTKDSGYIVAGETNSFGPGINNAYLVKLNSSGNSEWTKTIGGAGAQGIESIIQTSKNGFAATGMTYSYGKGGEVYVLKLDSTATICGVTSSGGIDSSGGSILSSDSGRVDSGGSITSSDSGRVGGGFHITYICGIPAFSNEVNTISANIELSPNPCTTTLTINLENASIIRNSKFVIEISDITGRVLLTSTLSLTTYPLSLNVSALVPGMYFLRINSGSGTEVKKFIKE